MHAQSSVCLNQNGTQVSNIKYSKVQTISSLSNIHAIQVCDRVELKCAQSNV